MLLPDLFNCLFTQECATERSYCLAMQSEGMLADLVRNLSTDSIKLKMLCANAIFRLAEEDESRNLVRMHGGLEKLVEMIKDQPSSKRDQTNMPLMAAVTGAMWKCATNNLENVDRLQDFNVVQLLIQVWQKLFIHSIVHE